MKKTIFFDFDGVLTTDPNGSYTTLYYIGKQIGLSYEALWPLWKKVSTKLYLGKDTIEHTWVNFCKEVGRDIDISMLDNAYAASPKNNEMFLLCRELARNYSLGIITDNPEHRLKFLEEVWSLEEIFFPIVSSYHVGVFKNDAKIFQYALEQLERKPEECIYIDNSQKNLHIPREMGVTVYYHDESKNDIAAFRKFLNGEDVVV